MKYIIENRDKKAIARDGIRFGDVGCRYRKMSTRNQERYVVVKYIFFKSSPNHAILSEFMFWEKSRKIINAKRGQSEAGEGE